MRAHKTYIIAEIGVNHNGSIKIAKNLIQEAKKLGANAVKFQKFIPNLMILDNTKKTSYQNKSTKTKESQKVMLNRYVLSDKDYVNLQKTCKKNNIDFLCTPFDDESLYFLLKKLKLKIIKISSTDLTNIPFLIKIAQSNVQVYLSTGMSNIEEVDIALSALVHGYKKFKTKFNPKLHKNIFKKYTKILSKKVTLMHCTSQYPAPTNELNLNILDMYKSRYSIPIGYSDHSKNFLTPIIAVAKNIDIIEVHITMSNKLTGPDHKSSLNIKDFKKYINLIKKSEIILGHSNKTVTSSEINVRKYARKSLTTTCSIKKGEIIKEKHFSVKRPGYGISPIHYYQYIGKKIMDDLSENKILVKEHFEKK